LSAREQEVMELIVEGKANKEIAAELDLSTKTVEFHRAHVMKKMGAESLAGLIHTVLIAKGLREP
jgi:FixJ family two-component response regulator